MVNRTDCAIGRAEEAEVKDVGNGNGVGDIDCVQTNAV